MKIAIKESKMVAGPDEKRVTGRNGKGTDAYSLS